MSDYVDFQYNLKKLSTLCASDERTQYTRFYKFEHPNCHRIQGGLQTGSGKIRIALVVFPDPHDKHLAWPVELEYKVLAHVNEKTELLATGKIKREAKEMEEFSEDISWANSTSVSLEELMEKNVIGPDDSVTFIWSVTLCCPSLESSQAAAKSPILQRDASTQADNVDRLDARNKLLDVPSPYGSMSSRRGSADSGIDIRSMLSFTPPDAITEEEVKYNDEGISNRKANEEVRDKDTGFEVGLWHPLTYIPLGKERKKTSIEGISYRKANKEGIDQVKLPGYEMACRSLDSTDLLLVGRSGNGKSALGNTILCKNTFRSINCTEPVTREFDFDFSEFEGRTIKVVDGPELGDTSLNYNDSAKLVVTKLSKAICTNTKGFHAILLVVRYGGRFTKEDMDTVNILKKLFGDKFITDHAVLVMTWGDRFSIDTEDTEQTVEQWCAEQEGVFQQLYTDVQKRAIMFDNKTKDRSIIADQVRRLLAVVDSMGARYTSKMFDEAAKIRERCLRIEKKCTCNEDAIRESGIITQMLSRVDYTNPCEGLKQLENLKKRTDVLHKDISQDKGTNSCSVAMKMTQNLEATITELLQKLQHVFDKIQQEQLAQSGKLEPKYEHNFTVAMPQTRSEEPDQSERPDTESDEKETEEQKAKNELETLQPEQQVQVAEKLEKQTKGNIMKKQKEEPLSEVKSNEKDQTNINKHEERQTMKFAEMKQKALQDLKTCIMHSVAEREKDYQQAKGESRDVWMKAAPELKWPRFGSFRGNRWK